MATGSIKVRTSLGTLEAGIVDEGGAAPGIMVTLVSEEGSAGIVSWTEVSEGIPEWDEAPVLQTHSYNGVDEEPVTVACDPRGEWMAEFPATPAPSALGHGHEGKDRPRGGGRWREGLVVLEARGRNALLFDPSNSLTPYIIASHFNHEDRTWGQGRHMSDLVPAVCALHDIEPPRFDAADTLEPLEGLAGFKPAQLAAAGLHEEPVSPVAGADIADGRQEPSMDKSTYHIEYLDAENHDVKVGFTIRAGASATEVGELACAAVSSLESAFGNTASVESLRVLSISSTDGLRVSFDGHPLGSISRVLEPELGALPSRDSLALLESSASMAARSRSASIRPSPETHNAER